MNRQKLEAALSAVTLDGGRMLSEGGCYCGLGAMPHAAGVPDEQLRAFDDEGAESKRQFRQNVDRRFGRLLAEFYGYSHETTSEIVIATVLNAVDDHLDVTPADVVYALEEVGVLAPT